MGRLDYAFFVRHAPVVACDLLGKVLVRSCGADELRGRVVEVEAYTGESDPGSHAYRGRTRRNEVMFGPAGRAYVYLSYGVHNCMNVVTDPDGTAGAVLLRALEPLRGIERMEESRGPRPVRDLCKGPGNLCRAFGITRENNGADLMGSDVWIDDDGYRSYAVVTGVRVGLSAGSELPLRFYVDGSPFVSATHPRLSPAQTDKHVDRTS